MYTNKQNTITWYNFWVAWKYFINSLILISDNVSNSRKQVKFKVDVTPKGIQTH